MNIFVRNSNTIEKLAMGVSNMRNYNKLKEKLQNDVDEAKKDISNLNKIAAEAKRVSEVARDVHIIINDLDRQFEKATKLNSVDIAFLFFATALQCTRQYLLTSFQERLTDKESAKDSKELEDKIFDKEGKGSIERKHRYYNPSLNEIILNPVPYDTIYGSPDFDLDLGNNHRIKTLGHDPLLGWVFGTANICTSTLTTWKFDSYHIKTGTIKTGANRDKITNNADTIKIIQYTKDRLLTEPQAVGAAIIKQGLHLSSDKYSKMGLPVPIISAISPEIAQKLAEFGIDMGNLQTVGKQAMYAVLINTLVAMIHGLFYDESVHGSRSLYEVKTRKILSYSNLIASVSNIIQAVFRHFVLQDTSAWRSLDIGGFIVTLWRIVTDYKFIKEIKFEFLEKEFYKIVMGDEFDF